MFQRASIGHQAGAGCLPDQSPGGHSPRRARANAVFAEELSRARRRARRAAAMGAPEVGAAPHHRARRVLLPLLVTHCGAAFLFLILAPAAPAGPCTSVREQDTWFEYP